MKAPVFLREPSKILSFVFNNAYPYALFGTFGRQKYTSSYISTALAYSPSGIGQTYPLLERDLNSCFASSTRAGVSKSSTVAAANTFAARSIPLWPIEDLPRETFCQE